MEEMLFPRSRSLEERKMMRLSYPEASPVKKFRESSWGRLRRGERQSMWKWTTEKSEKRTNLLSRPLQTIRNTKDLKPRYDQKSVNSEIRFLKGEKQGRWEMSDGLSGKPERDPWTIITELPLLLWKRKSSSFPFEWSSPLIYSNLSRDIWLGRSKIYEI